MRDAPADRRHGRFDVRRDGIGLAAVQIGAPQRVIVMDLDQRDARRTRAISSIRSSPGGPRRSRPSRKAASRPEIWEDVERAARIRRPISTATASLTSWKPTDCSRHVFSTRWTISKGVLFIDHLSKLKRSIALRKLQKAKRLKRRGRAWLRDLITSPFVGRVEICEANFGWGAMPGVQHRPPPEISSLRPKISTSPRGGGEG